jgi:hypothetical protein
MNVVCFVACNVFRAAGLGYLGYLSYKKPVIAVGERKNQIAGMEFAVYADGCVLIH